MAFSDEARAKAAATNKAKFAARRAAAGTPNVSGGRERKPAGRKPTHSQLRKNVASILTMANLSAAGVLPPQVRPDLLSTEEIEVLATGITVELEANPKLLAYFQRLAAVSGPHVVMLAACAVIAAPRMARRGMLPIPAAQAVITAGTALVSGHAGGAHGTADMEPGPAPGGGRRNGVWQVDTDGVAGQAEEMAPLRADQAG